MEIRPPLTTPPVLVTQTRQNPHTSGEQPAAIAGISNRESRASRGLTEFISQGELVDEGGATDYRDLLRAARLQQAQAIERGSQPAGVTSPYVNRALAAYQSNAAAEDTEVPQPRIDSRV